jgi:hypothetical protein
LGLSAFNEVMKTILFRGKTITGEWVYGYYEFDEHLNQGLIRNGKGFVSEVLVKTVGQFTGYLLYENRNIFEGDLLKRKQKVYEVIYEDYYAAFILKSKGAIRSYHFDNWDVYDFTPIGNIYDNPELL